MRVLILGGDGMLGSQLFRHLAPNHDVRVTLRQELPAYEALPIVAPPDRSFFGVDARDFSRVADVVKTFRPEAVVNAVGIVKQRSEAADALTNLEINAVFPHRLFLLCGSVGARLVHFSTDCVFSGRRGGYGESDLPDAEDLYGRTKLLGEVAEAPAVTLRSSIIGLEVRPGHGLVEWFLRSRGVIKGYRKAVFSGLTTLEMARLVELILTRRTDLFGLWHVAADPIDKYSLLTRLAQALGRRDVQIEPDDAFLCDRSLRGEALRAATGWRAPDWPRMVGELAEQIKAREREA